MKKFTAGVIGTGFIGAAHVEALRRMGNVEVVAITETNNPAEKANMLCIDQYFTDYKEMIDKCNLDCIHICTPNDTHLPITKYAMDHGVNVVCEKPMNRDQEEAKQMVEIAKKTGLVGAVNFHNRFYPINHHLRNYIKDGSLGKIMSVHGGYVQDWLLYDTDYNWRLHSKESGKTRAVADIGSHWLDLVQYVTGMKIVEVMAEFSTVYPKRKRPLKPIQTFSKVKLEENNYEEFDIDTEDLAVINCRFENGAIGNAMIHQMFAGKKNKITMFIAGTEQSAEWDSDDSNNVVIGFRDKGNIVLNKDPKLIHDKSYQISSYPGGHVEGFPDAFKQNFINIYKKIENPNAESQFATFEDGMFEMHLCDVIYESAQKRQWIKV